MEIIEPLLAVKPDMTRGRPVENSGRSIVDGIFTSSELAARGKPVTTISGYGRKWEIGREFTMPYMVRLASGSPHVQDRDGARLLFNVLTVTFGWLKLIWGRGGYSGKLVEHVAGIFPHRRVNLEIVKRSDDIKGFKVLPKRWIVETHFRVGSSSHGG